MSAAPQLIDSTRGANGTHYLQCLVLRKPCQVEISRAISQRLPNTERLKWPEINEMRKVNMV